MRHQDDLLPVAGFAGAGSERAQPRQLAFVVNRAELKQLVGREVCRVESDDYPVAVFEREEAAALLGAEVRMAQGYAEVALTARVHLVIRVERERRRIGAAAGGP